MHAEFPDQRIERHHLGGMVGRHLHRLFRREDVKLVGIEDQALVGARRNRLPEVADLVCVAPFDVDQPGMAFGAIADELVGPEAGQIDADGHAFAHIGVGGVDQPFLVMQRGQRRGRRAALRRGGSEFATAANPRAPGWEKCAG